MVRTQVCTRSWASRAARASEKNEPLSRACAAGGPGALGRRCRGRHGHAGGRHHDCQWRYRIAKQNLDLRVSSRLISCRPHLQVGTRMRQGSTQAGKPKLFKLLRLVMLLRLVFQGLLIWNWLFVSVNSANLHTSGVRATPSQASIQLEVVQL